jgi:hypothetical protein
MKRTPRTSRRSRVALLLLLACFPARASIFIVAICKDGVVAVADSRFTFFDNDTGRALAYADGLEKIIRFQAALLAETGQGFLGEERFDLFVKRFEEGAGSLPVELLLPSLLEYGVRRLPAQDQRVLEQQHMAVAKLRGERPIICGYDGRLRPCVDRGYVQSSPTDFERLSGRLPTMSAPEVAAQARVSMERYIAAYGKSATMGGDFSAAVLTPSGIRDLWPLRNPVTALTLRELIAFVAARRIPVTLIPPATRSDLEQLLEPAPTR